MSAERRDYALEGNATMDTAMRRRHAGLQAAFLLPFLSPHMSLVDVGCGQGTISIGLARSLESGSVLGFDTQEVHIARANELATEEAVTNVRFMVADLFGESLPQAAFDVAYANAVLSHQSKPEEGLRAIARLVKPGGLIALRDRGGKSLVTGEGSEATLRGLEIMSSTIDAVSQNPLGSQTMGPIMNRMCREASLDVLHVSASWDVETTAHLGGNPNPIAGPLGQRAIQLGITNAEEIERVIRVSQEVWLADPDGIMAVPWFEVVARKP